MPNKRCYNCMHNEYCYACSISFPERAESCAAYNDKSKRELVDKQSVKQQWEANTK